MRSGQSAELLSPRTNSKFQAPERIPSPFKARLSSLLTQAPLNMPAFCRGSHLPNDHLSVSVRELVEELCQCFINIAQPAR